MLLLKRAIEVLVGLGAIGIAMLSLWVCYDLVAYRPTLSGPAVAPATRWSVVYAVGFLAFVAGLFGVRLISPGLRVEGGRVIGRRGLIAFSLLYGLLCLRSLIQGSIQAQLAGVAAALGVALTLAIRSTFGDRTD